MYDNIPVALKITWDDGISFMKNEIPIYNALSATTDLNIDSHEILRIYYSGNILDNYIGIAMTLSFVESEVEALEFLHSNHVIHNDIKPANIFLRDTEVFIGGKRLQTQ